MLFAPTGAGGFCHHPSIKFCSFEKAHGKSQEMFFFLSAFVPSLCVFFRSILASPHFVDDANSVFCAWQRQRQQANPCSSWCWVQGPFGIAIWHFQLLAPLIRQAICLWLQIWVRNSMDSFGPCMSSIRPFWGVKVGCIFSVFLIDWMSSADAALCRSLSALILSSTCSRFDLSKCDHLHFASHSWLDYANVVRCTSSTAALAMARVAT